MALNIINKRLKIEEKKLKESKNEYRKRVVSYSIVILRDLYEMIEELIEAK